MIALQDGLLKDAADLRSETVGRTTDTKTGAYAARFNEAIRCQMPAAGGALTFPAAAVGSVDKWIEVIVLGGGPVKVQPTSGLIDGVASVSLSTPGRFMFRSDGLNSWWRATGGPPALGSVTLAMLAAQAANTIVANATAAAASPTAVSVGVNTVVGRQGGNIIAAQIVALQIANNTITANQIANNTISATQQTQMAANTVKANPTAGAANESDLAVGTNTILGRQGGNIVASPLIDAQITANTISAASQVQMAANSLKGNATAAPANEADQTLSVQSILLRASGNIVNSACAADQVLGRVGSGDLGFGPTPRLLRAPQVLTSGTSISHPAGTRVLIVRGVGGGGAGGGLNAAAGSIGAPGGSGTYGEKTFLAPAASSTYAVGAAGTGVSGAAGNPGGNSTFTNGATTVTLPGGTAGGFLAGAATIATIGGGLNGTAATNADWSITGVGGEDGQRIAAATTPCVVGGGGSNPLGQGSPGKWTSTTVTNAPAPTGFGAGGGGRLNGTTAVAQAGINGTQGVWIVEEWG